MIDIGATPNEIDMDIVTLNPTELVELLLEGRHPRLSLCVIAGAD
jgi:hypothetical protein